MPIYSSQSWKLGGPTHTWQSSVSGEHSRPGCKWCLLLLPSCGRNQEIASPQSRGLHPNDLVTSPRPCLLVWPHGCVRISACKAWGKTNVQSIVVAVQYLNHAQVFQLHELKHARPPHPSPSPGVCLNSWPLSRCCHPTISSSATLFSFFPQCIPAIGFFLMSQLFTSGGQSIRASASDSKNKTWSWLWLRSSALHSKMQA